ncbi:MAG TPA: lipocalin family protein [Flavitalea sp.]|nr:lipocalin family protein [Flavitalea sp.]
MRKPIIVALLLAVFAIISCNKDGDNGTPVTSIDLITSGTWNIDTIGFDSDKNGTIDSPVPGGLKACELDNTLTFNKDSATGIFDEGALKCDPADPQTTNFGYTVKGDSVINYTGDLPGELKGDVNILTLNNTQFIMSKRIVLTFPVQFDQNIIISLKKN